MLGANALNNLTNVFENFACDSDSGFEGSPPSSPSSSTNMTNSMSFDSAEPDEENFSLSSDDTLCLPNFNMMDYCSMFSDISDDNCLGGMDFLFEDNFTSLYKNVHSNEQLCDEVDFDFSFEDFPSGVKTSDTILNSNEVGNSEQNAEETRVLDHKKELNSGNSENFIEPEVTNSHSSKRGFPEFPVKPSINKDNGENFLKQTIRLDHCYCRTLEVSHTKSSTPISIGLDRDQRYWQRRNRNNAAARRSREAKRAKDIEMWKRAQSLESENAQLRKELKELIASVEKNEKKLRFYGRS